MSGGESNDSSQVHYGAGLSAGFNDSVSLESGFRGSAVGPDVYSSSECLPARAQFSSGLYSQPSQLYSPADDSHPLGDGSHGVSMSGRHGESHSENVVSSGAPVSDLTHMISSMSGDNFSGMATIMSPLDEHCSELTGQSFLVNSPDLGGGAPKFTMVQNGNTYLVTQPQNTVSLVQLGDQVYLPVQILANQTAEQLNNDNGMLASAMTTPSSSDCAPSSKRCSFQMSRRSSRRPAKTNLDPSKGADSWLPNDSLMEDEDDEEEEEDDSDEDYYEENDDSDDDSDEEPRGVDQKQTAVLMNSGESVTILATKGPDSKDMGYVLIVQPKDSKKDTSIYDFGEEDEERDTPSEGHLHGKASADKAEKGALPQYLCQYCQYVTSKKYLLTRHMKTHSADRPHKCNVCDRSFKSLISLQNHVNTHTGVKPHKCKECEMSFTTSGELARHTRYRHTKERPHRCPECGYATVELSKLRRHIRTHTGERPYKCPHCSYASPDSFKLKRHLRVHTGEKPYECKICGQRFTQSNSLKAHMPIHTGDKPMYRCPHCPTTCGRKTDLRHHIQKMHANEDGMACSKCGKEFADRYSLKEHKKMHKGERCFKCTICDFSTFTKRALEQHILSHTGEKPYMCEQCGLSFKQKPLLKRHLATFHDMSEEMPKSRPKIFRCGECDKNFANPANLRKHLMVHEKGDRALRDLDKDAASEMEMAVDGLDPKSPMDSDTNSTDTYACESDVL